METLSKGFFISLLRLEWAISDCCGLFLTAKERKMHLMLNQGSSGDMGLGLLPGTEMCKMCLLLGKLLVVLICFHIFQILGKERVDATSRPDSSLWSVSAYHCELPNDMVQCLVLGPDSLSVAMTCVPSTGSLYWQKFFIMLLVLSSKLVSSHLPTLFFKGFKSMNVHVVDFADMPTSKNVSLITIGCGQLFRCNIYLFSSMSTTTF